MDEVIDQELANELRALYRELRDAADSAAVALGGDRPATLCEADLERFIQADRQVACIVRTIIALRD